MDQTLGHLGHQKSTLIDMMWQTKEDLFKKTHLFGAGVVPLKQKNIHFKNNLILDLVHFLTSCAK